MQAYEPALEIADKILFQDLNKLYGHSIDYYSFRKTWLDNWRHDDNPFEKAIDLLNDVGDEQGATENLNKLPAANMDLEKLFVDFNRCHCCSFYIEQESNAVICEQVGNIGSSY